jgi:putative aminopeptidase FrvX
LPEFRRKGLAKGIICRAIQSIRKDHPIKALFVWTFSEEGGALARTVARAVDLPLYGRES